MKGRQHNTACLRGADLGAKRTIDHAPPWAWVCRISEEKVTGIGRNSYIYIVPTAYQGARISATPESATRQYC